MINGEAQWDIKPQQLDEDVMVIDMWGSLLCPVCGVVDRKALSIFCHLSVCSLCLYLCHISSGSLE